MIRSFDEFKRMTEQPRSRRTTKQKIGMTRTRTWRPSLDEDDQILSQSSGALKYCTYWNSSGLRTNDEITRSVGKPGHGLNITFLSRVLKRWQAKQLEKMVDGKSNLWCL